MLDVLIFISMITGILLTAHSLFKIKSEGHEKSTDTESLNKYIEEADEAAEDLSRLSKSILDEINGKYQELLYLYNLIDEKQKTLEEPTFEAYASDSVQKLDHKRKVSAEKSQKKSFSKNPKHDEILALRKSGLGAADIAKKLGMGQGEVKLILELGKDNHYAP